MTYNKPLEEVYAEGIKVLPVQLVNTHLVPFSVDKHKDKKYFYFYVKKRGGNVKRRLRGENKIGYKR